MINFSTHNFSLQLNKYLRLIFLIILSCFCLINSAFAQISFGRTQTNSTTGQPLSAQIEVIASPQDAATIRARSYRPLPGGGIDTTITTSIIRGANGVIIQLGSLTPINEPFVDVVVELISATGASVSRSFSLLVNPSANNAYSLPQQTYSARKYSPPRPTIRNLTNPPVKAKAPVSLEELDKRIASAKDELAKLSAQLESLAAVTPSEKPVEIVVKAPDVSPIIPVVPEPPIVVVDPTPSIILPPVAIQPPPATVVVTPPVVEPIVTPPPVVVAEPSKAPVIAPPPVKPKVIPPTVVAKNPVKEEGLFGIEWLPNPMSILADFGLDSFFTTEILMGIGALLVAIAGYIIFTMFRKKRRLNVLNSPEEDLSKNPFGGVTDSFSNNAESTISAPIPATTNGVATTETKEEVIDDKPKKKKSFLSRLKKLAKKEDNTAEEASDEQVDFSKLVEESSKPNSSSKVETKNEAKIIRFNEDDVGAGKNVASAKTDDDFLNDLESITKTGISVVEPTILVNSPSQTKSDSGETRLSPAKAGIIAESSSIPFSDEITRIAPKNQEADDLISSSIVEMDINHKFDSKTNAKPIKIENISANKPQVKAVPEPANTDTSFDDLDFSSEKTMIMPQLKELVKEAEAKIEDGGGGGGIGNGDFEFNLDIKPSGTTKVLPFVETKVQPIAEEPNPVNVYKKNNTASIANIDSLNIDELLSANAPVIAKPAPEQTMANLDLPSFDLPTPQAPARAPTPTSVSKTQLAPTQIPHSSNEISLDSLELPNLDLPDLEAIKVKSVEKKAESGNEKAKNTQNTQVMIDLAALDLSSIKLD